MERLVNNFIIAVALSVVEEYERRRRTCWEGRGMFDYPIHFAAAVEARATLALLDEALWCQEQFSIPHGKLWQSIGVSA